MDWTMDWTMNWIIDSILELILDWTTNYLVFQNFPGLPTVQFLIASSLVPKDSIIQTSMHFSAYMAALRPRQCIGR